MFFCFYLIVPLREDKPYVAGRSHAHFLPPPRGFSPGPAPSAGSTLHRGRGNCEFFQEERFRAFKKIINPCPADIGKAKLSKTVTDHLIKRSCKNPIPLWLLVPVHFSSSRPPVGEIDARTTAIRIAGSRSSRCRDNDVLRPSCKFSRNCTGVADCVQTRLDAS